VSPKRAGLPVALKMRHNAHYVDELISRTDAAIGRMIRAKGNDVSLSVGPVYLNLVSGSNWGVATGPTLVVTLDPQVNARSPNLEDAVEMTPPVTDSEQRDVIMKLESGSLSLEQFSAWLQQRCARRSQPK
jgi:hypothetical protein